jgi:hypothetical protein
MNLTQPERAAGRATQALDLYIGLGDSRGAARVLDARAMATFLDGDVRGGVALLHRVANLFEDSGGLVRTVTPRSTRGHGLVFAGQASDGLADIDRALDVARGLGQPEGQTYTLWHRTEALTALGRHDEAHACAEEALAIATRIGHRGWTATAWRAIGVVCQARGELATAYDAFIQSDALSENLDLFSCWAAARAAIVAIGLGMLDTAEPLVARARTTGPGIGRYESSWAAAELACARGAPHAAELVADAVATAQAGGARLYLDRLNVLMSGQTNLGRRRPGLARST